VGNDALESVEQGTDLTVATVQLLRDEQPVRRVAT
jgi:hypothetical protein